MSSVGTACLCISGYEVHFGRCAHRYLTVPDPAKETSMPTTVFLQLLHHSVRIFPHPQPMEKQSNTDSKPSHALRNESRAVLLNGDWLPSDYASLVDETLLGVKFRPDIFQKQAFYFLSKGESVFVSAHTSSGKTLVAEYAILLAKQNESRVIYTSPIKALSNQKFYDFKQKFPDVGLITGDVQVNPDAKCLIMTTEILRNLVYKNSDILRDTEFVVFDEVHYINDVDRGVVWEECIIMLPRHTSLVMLSATIPNAAEFAEWVGRTKKRCVYVISTAIRAVPLEFAVYCDAEAFSLEDAPNTRSRSSLPTNFSQELKPFSKKTKIANRFRINDLGNYVNNKRLTPAIFFTFSKRVCGEHGRSLQLLDLTTPFEKSSIQKFLEDAMSNLREEDRNLPQVRTMRDQVYRGVGVHHGALLPFVKECVEILFSDNLIKILVATETFAMGVNMPAKCCAFLSLTKIDGGSFRYLSTGEFIQMSGRAGRRGMDKVGTVLIADQRMPPVSTIRKVIGGMQTNLSSQFKLSFSLILMALRSNVEVEELMRSSFREHGSQRNSKPDMAKLSRLESCALLSCGECEDYLDVLGSLRFIGRENPFLIKRNVGTGDVVVLKNNSVVTIRSISQNRFSYSSFGKELDQDFFTRPLNGEIEEMYRKNEPKYLTKYPIIYRKECGDGVATFDDTLFCVKDCKISFDYQEIEIHLVSKAAEIRSAFERVRRSKHIRCDQFSRHYLEAVKSKAIVDEVHLIRNRYANESLVHIGEYSSRVKFLKLRGFLEDSITLKGRVAAELRTVNDVLVTEMIFSNEFGSFSPPEIVSVLSAMICEENAEESRMEEGLEKKALILERYFEELAKSLEELDIPNFEPLNFGMAQSVYDWCDGASLGCIVARHRVSEGSFVRLVLRLDECCREMINAARLIGDRSLEEKLASASATMRRDIVFLPSLYI